MDIVNIVREELAGIGYPHNVVKTAQVRALSAQIFRTLPDKNISAVLTLSEALLDIEGWAGWVISYDWAFRVRKQYTRDTFFIFERWLKTYVRDWGDCDDFCTHALGELIAQHNDLYELTTAWVDHENFAVRRAAAVVLIYPIMKGRYAETLPLKTADLLFSDEHYLVQKGYGWMLKVLSKKEPDTVINYLESHYQEMPRTAFRYAMEKLDKNTRRRLMAL
ncbi:DNA alkylation repair protein [Veronia nyctiphanis]|uniref:DNA alkylation repair protein n=1 Tax=Veronia nyctiphanis TaxID=1278244 RepID=A0A4Q0YJF7_9GAMM|nr:DNA alkylation repair protein [Veronia nyctiphanis]RXJ70852.1 DNA alkylation repair protein [Veronia nyctiphanis]